MAYTKQVETGDEYQVRLEKVAKLRAAGINPYADKYEASTNIEDLRVRGDKAGDKVPHLEAVQEGAVSTQDRIRGRIMLWREHGNLIFARLQDESGQIQIAFTKKSIGDEKFKLLKLVDVGDFLGVEGELFLTMKGELSFFVREYTFLAKTLRPLPEKFHGLTDVEKRYQQRYLDILTNPDVAQMLKTRSLFIHAMREFYHTQGFTEVQTPVLQHAASGALAKPFVTHHNALDADFYLRIALETHQKELIGAGLEKIFEIGPVFRNEGIDPSHLQEFTMCEHYAAYWDYRDNMKFTQEMIQNIIKKIKGTLIISIPDHDGVMQEVDFSGDWKEVTFRELLMRDIDIDITEFTTADELRAELKKRKIILEDMDTLGLGNLIDALYKKVSRPKLLGPVFVTQHPLDLSPLARRNDKNPDTVDRFQLVVNTWEIVNAYSELVDPVDQKNRFESQSEAREKGDEEAHSKDDEYVLAMEHGFPPISGWGMGIDRMVALLTGASNLKEVVWFPLVRGK